MRGKREFREGEMREERKNKKEEIERKSERGQ